MKGEPANPGSSEKNIYPFNYRWCACACVWNLV